MKIGEVSAKTGVSQRMIRHYEKTGLIAPAARRDSGPARRPYAAVHRPRPRPRVFDGGDRQLLALWQDRGRSSADVKALALARAAELRRKARELDAMRRSLERLAAHCHGDDRPDCPILDDLEADS